MFNTIWLAYCYCLGARRRQWMSLWPPLTTVGKQFVKSTSSGRIKLREICPKTITLLLCKLMDKHQTCSTPITSPKWKKCVIQWHHQLNVIQEHHQKKHIIQRHNFGDLSCIHLSQSHFWDMYLMTPSSSIWWAVPHSCIFRCLSQCVHIKMTSLICVCRILMAPAFRSPPNRHGICSS